MPHYGTLRDYRFTDADEATDVRGSKVYGFGDEKLGKIDDIVFDHSTGHIYYVVVDTGGWLSSNKFIVPPEALRPSVDHEGDYRVDLTQDQIESLPPYNESDLESEEKWADYNGRYRSQWEAKPIMHRVATDRNITPPRSSRLTPDRAPCLRIMKKKPCRTSPPCGRKLQWALTPAVPAGAGTHLKIACGSGVRKSSRSAPPARVRPRPKPPRNGSAIGGRPARSDGTEGTAEKLCPSQAWHPIQHGRYAKSVQGLAVTGSFPDPARHGSPGERIVPLCQICRRAGAWRIQKSPSFSHDEVLRGKNCRALLRWHY